MTYSSLFSLKLLTVGIADFLNDEEDKWTTNQAWFWLQGADKGRVLCSWQDEIIPFYGVIKRNCDYALNMGDGFMILGETTIQDIYF